jgi:hypothetical protein
VTRSGTLAIAILTLLAANLARVRSDAAHVVPSVVVGFAAGAILLERLLRLRRPAARALAAPTALLLIATALPGAALHSMLPGGAVRERLDAPADPARVSNLPVHRQTRAAAEWIRQNVPEEERIFVGCGRHDRVFASEPLLYFMSRRRPGTRFHLLDPGMVTTRSAQDEIVNDLERHRVRFVVLSKVFDGRREPNGSAISSGVTRLDDFLRERYAEVAAFPPTHVVLRRTAPWVSGEEARAGHHD